jgi:hypothetical protein
MWSQIKRLKNDGQDFGISSLQVPVNSDDEFHRCKVWRTVQIAEVQKRSSQELLTTRNRNHFGQAEGTSLTVWQQPRLNYTGEGIVAESVLMGNFEYADEFDESTQLVLEHLKATVLLDSISMEITKEQFLKPHSCLEFRQMVFFSRGVHTNSVLSLIHASQTQ